VTASARNAVRAVTFVGATFVALVFSQHVAHADDGSAQSVPAPDSGTGSGTPPTDASTPTAPATPPVTAAPQPTPSPAPAPAPVVLAPPALPTGDVDAPATSISPSLPPPPGSESAAPPAHPPVSGTGTQTDQSAVVTTGGTSVANTGGNTSSGQVTNASATGTITYNYQPLADVPEPGAWAFLGTSLIGGGFFAIRRRRK